MMHVTRALTLTEPWATLMVIGAKRVETRDWPTTFRGPFAIHAAKKMDVNVCREEPFQTVLQNHFGCWGFLGHFKLGYIIGVAELLHCSRTEDLAPHQSPQELAFGDFHAGRFGFSCDYAERLRKPIPARGMLNFWHIPLEVRLALEAAA